MLETLWRLTGRYCYSFKKFTYITQPAFTCLKLTTETLEEGVKYVQSWCRSGVFIINFEHISHLVLVFLLLNLSK